MVDLESELKQLFLSESQTLLLIIHTLMTTHPISSDLSVQPDYWLYTSS
jgi:hypothetical protein